VPILGGLCTEGAEYPPAMVILLTHSPPHAGAKSTGFAGLQA
jgi:hypothetical protein